MKSLMKYDTVDIAIPDSLEQFGIIKTNLVNANIVNAKVVNPKDEFRNLNPDYYKIKNEDYRVVSKQFMDSFNREYGFHISDYYN